MDPLVEPGPPLRPEQALTYARHLLLPEVGELAQRRLLAARVAVIGAGGLGSPALLYLAAAGVGSITLIDDDTVDLSNLQRQVLHGRADVGRSKLESAAESIRAVSPEITLDLRSERLTPQTSHRLLAGHDLVLDGTDTFETRYAVSDACAALGLPLVWAAVLGFDAQVSVFGSGDPPLTLRDLFPAPPPPGSVPSCAEAGVLGSLTGQVGSIMATEAIKLITGVGEPLVGRVLVIDGLRQRFTEVPLKGRGAAAPEPAQGQAARSSAGQDHAIGPRSAAVPTISQQDARAAHARGSAFLDVRDEHETAAGMIDGAAHVPLPLVLANPALIGRIPVVVYCASGSRSARAVAAIRAHGVDARSLAGGYEAWTAVGT